ncbi:MAG: PEGA domain-containing protein [Lachnospiraceae bacterium]|nr:PEGA domain-containing protein [Lachnospiraceae bacterium]
MRDASRIKNGVNKGKKKRVTDVFLIAMTMIVLSGCANPFSYYTNLPTPVPDRVDTGFVATGPNSFDSADTAILVGRDEKENTMTFLNLDIGRKYTLSMDGTTRMYDRHGGVISLNQLRMGDIVDVTFLKSKKHLTTMQLSSRAWSISNVERYEMNSARNEISIGSQVYKLTSNTQYFSEGRTIDLMDLNVSDVLSFQGIDNQILTVSVEKGHGYLRLVNDENFVGGWIEIGQSQIRKITEDMLLTVPEGSYQVNVTNRGGGGMKSVKISRNEETELDVGDLKIPEPQSGVVLFSLTPSTADLYIDGSKVDASVPVTLEYGLHQLIARAEGYQSVTQYISVSQESTGINVVLDTTAREESTPPSDEPEDTTANYYKVYVDAPEGVEVYLDGNYVGVSPCSFRKTEGSHVITLRKTDYETRSYTVEIDDTERDLSYSFADLVENALTNP